MAKTRPSSSDEYTRTRLLNRLGLFQSPQSGSVRLRYKPSSSSSPSGLVSSDLSTTKYPTVCRGANHHVQNHHRRKPSILGEINPTQVKLKEGTVGGAYYVDDSSSCTEQSPSSITSSSPTSSTADIATDFASTSPPSTTSSSSCIATANTTTPMGVTIKPRRAVRFNENAAVVIIPSRYQYSDRIRKFLWSNKYEIMENAERNIIEYEAEGWDWNAVVLEEEMFVDSITGSLVHPCHLLLDGDGDMEGGSSTGSNDDLSESHQQKEQHQLYDPPEQDSDGADDEDDDDDSYFRPLERQPSVATSLS